MKYSILLLLIAFLVNNETALGQDANRILLGEKLTITSSILNEERTLLISLPDSYNEPSNIDKQYPIIILLDGYTHFKATVGTVHFMSSNVNRNYLMPESIIVAIENIDRERDFTVTKIKTVRPNTMGGGKKFLDFIENELIPFIDIEYRTEPSRTLIGHSLAGLLTINAYMDKTSVFNAYLAIDPSIWWDDAMIENKVDTISLDIFHKKLFIATANQGAANSERNKKRHETLYKFLNLKSDESSNLSIEYFEHEDHRSIPLVALYSGLKFLNASN